MPSTTHKHFFRISIILYKPGTDCKEGNAYEGVVLCGYMLSLKLHSKIPVLSAEYYAALARIINNFGTQWKIRDQISEELPEFVEKRNILYHKCFNLLKDQMSRQMVFHKISYNL